LPDPTPSEAEYRPELYQEIPPGYYDEVYATGRGTQWFWHHHRFARVAERLPARMRRLVDLGCGPGTFLGHLDDRFDEALGVDIAVPQIEYARQRYRRAGLEFRVADLVDLAADSGFDAAVSIEVIEHLPAADAQRLLAALFDLLEPGATLVLTTPNYRSAWPLLELLVSRIGPVDYTVQHINRFDRHRLARTLSAVGFSDVEVHTFFVVSPFIAPLSRRLAEVALRWEARFLPYLGAELVARARKPARPAI
jgi:2-polyprenyl-3-methyl-5-hydroxy-6-metoxy-1,4-benzoquinol methylase